MNLRRIIKPGFLFIRWLLQQPVLFLKNSKVHMTSRVERGVVLVNSRIGKYNYIGGGVYLNNTEIMNYCSIASGVKVGGMEHSWWWGSTSSKLSKYNIHDKVTTVEDDVWIAANAVIRQGVNVGRGAVVGAGAVVLSDVPPYSIVAGVPAKIIKTRFPDAVVQEILNTKFWLFSPDSACRLLESIDYPPSPDHWRNKDSKEAK